MAQKPEYISILSDFGFKRAFADESNTLFLRKSLEALIQSPTEIEIVEFLKNDIAGLTSIGRGMRFDTVCKDAEGNNFIVEMQLTPYEDFVQRAKFYAFHRFNTLVKKGIDNPFKGLPTIYLINFLANDIFPESQLYYHIVTLKNQINEEIDRQIVYVFVEISKFDKKEHELEGDADKLIYLMKNIEEIQQTGTLPPFLNEDWILEAMERLNEGGLTPDQRANLEVAVAQEASEIAAWKEQLKKVEEAEAKAEEAEAKAEKIEAEAKQSKITTAKTLKENGIDIQLIVESTGLSIEEIEQL